MLSLGGDNTVLVAMTNLLSDSSWVCSGPAEKSTAEKKRPAGLRRGGAKRV